PSYRRDHPHALTSPNPGLRSPAHTPRQEPPRHPALPQTQHLPAPLPNHGVFSRHPRDPHRRRLTNIGASNGLLRQYFPKGTDLRVHSPEVLKAAEDRLNNRPRKTLGWQTPTQVFDAALR